MSNYPDDMARYDTDPRSPEYIHAERDERQYNEAFDAAVKAVKPLIPGLRLLRQAADAFGLAEIGGTKGADRIRCCINDLIAEELQFDLIIGICADQVQAICAIDQDLNVDDVCAAAEKETP